MWLLLNEKPLVQATNQVPLQPAYQPCYLSVHRDQQSLLLALNRDGAMAIWCRHPGEIMRRTNACLPANWRATIRRDFHWQRDSLTHRKMVNVYDRSPS